MPTTLILSALLMFGILTIWIPDRWAWSVEQVGIYSLGAVCAIRCAFRGPVRWNRILLLPLTVTLLALVQLAAGATVYRWATWTSVLDWSTYLAAMWIALYVGADPFERRRFLWILVYFGFAVCVLGAVQNATSGGKIFWVWPSGYPDTILGPFIHHGQFSVFVELLFPVAFAAALREQKRWFPAVIVGGMVATVAVSGSRGGALLLLAEMIAVTLHCWRKGLAMKSRLVACSVVIAVFVGVTGTGELLPRFSKADPLDIRRELNLSSLQMIRNNPLLGTGMGTWTTVYPRYASYDDGTWVNAAHSDWLQWTVEGGLGLGLTLVLFGVMLVRTAFRSSWGIGSLAAFLHCSLDYPMQRPALAVLFFVIAAAIHSGTIREE